MNKYTENYWPINIGPTKQLLILSGQSWPQEATPKGPAGQIILYLQLLKSVPIYFLHVKLLLLFFQQLPNSSCPLSSICGYIMIGNYPLKPQCTNVMYFVIFFAS